jgi:Flp pilus assembly pilin Flp
MSDFLTTTRVNTGLAFATAVRHMRRLRHEAGQTAAEYMGVLLVVSVIIAAVSTTGIGTEITGKMSDLVGYIASGKDGKQEGNSANTPPAHNGNGGNEGGGR